MRPGHRSNRAAFALGALALPMLFCAIAAAFLAVPRAAHASNIILEWTAPGDDSTFGRAAEYDLRWSTRSNQFPVRFYTARRIATAPPSAAGALEHLVIQDLPEGVPVYFALRSRDIRGNWSVISNVLSAQMTADVADGGLPLAFSEAFPSPARVQTAFALTLPARGDALVEAIDVAGRIVRTLQRGELAPGRHTLMWDLRDDAGHRSAPGVYFVRARTGGQEFVRRVVVLH